MSFTERKILFEKFSAIRNHPMITYVTSIRPNLSINMSSDAITEIINAIERIPSEVQDIDFMIISNGGDPITSLRIINILRERFNHITVVVPYVGYSAATILALGADDIMMHPFSNLGPVDPQLTIPKTNVMGQNSDIHFSSEDIRNYIEFLKQDVGITDQEHLAAISNLTAEVGTIPIGNAKRSQQLSLSLSRKILETHLEDKSTASNIAQKLNSSFYHHGYAVNRKEAQEIGLNITIPSEKEEDLIWSIWKDYSNEMKMDKDFNLLNELMNDPSSKTKLETIPILELPANTPTDIANQLLINYASQIPIITRTPIEFEVLLAIIESSDISYEIKNSFSVIYWRNADMTLGFNAIPYCEGWKERVRSGITISSK